MTTSKGWYIFFVGGALLACSSLLGQGSPLSVSLSKGTIAPGERAVLSVSIPVQPGSKNVQINDTLLRSETAWKILKSSHATTDGVATWKFEITGYIAGSLSLPPIEVTVGGNSYSSEQTPIEVVTSVAENDYNIRPGFGFQTLKWFWPWRLMSLALLALLALAAVAYGLRWLKRRWPKPIETLQANVAPKEDPDEWLRIQLDAYQEQISNESPLLLDKFVEIVRGYLSKKYEINANALTTRQLNQHFLKHASVQQLIPLFEHCDSHRFEGQKTPVSELAQTCLKKTENALL